LGKLTLNHPFRPWIQAAITDLGVRLHRIEPEHAAKQSELPFHHRDPFDRLLIAQALLEGLTLVSSDAAFEPYAVPRLWA